MQEAVDLFLKENYKIAKDQCRKLSLTIERARELYLEFQTGEFTTDEPEMLKLIATISISAKMQDSTKVYITKNGFKKIMKDKDNIFNINYAYNRVLIAIEEQTGFYILLEKCLDILVKNNKEHALYRCTIIGGHEAGNFLVFYLSEAFHPRTFIQCRNIAVCSHAVKSNYIKIVDSLDDSNYSEEMKSNIYCLKTARTAHSCREIGLHNKDVELKDGNKMAEWAIFASQVIFASSKYMNTKIKRTAKRTRNSADSIDTTKNNISSSTNNEFIIVYPYITEPKEEGEKREIKSSPKAEHKRRGYYRTYRKTGKKVWVNSCHINKGKGTKVYQI